MPMMDGVERAAIDRDLFQCSTLNAQRSTFNCQLLMGEFCSQRWTLNVRRSTLMFAIHEKRFGRPTHTLWRARQGAGRENGAVVPQSATGWVHSLRPQYRKRRSAPKAHRRFARP